MEDTDHQPYHNSVRNPRKGGQVTSLEIEHAEKDRKALELRARGLTYDRIAEELGYSDRSGGRKAVERALARTMQDAGDAARGVELDRLDRLLERWWPIAMETEMPSMLTRATDAVLKIMERRAKYLGLDQAPNVDATTRILILARQHGYDEEQALEAARRILRETQGKPGLQDALGDGQG
jgi:hypothetical protein